MREMQWRLLEIMRPVGKNGRSVVRPRTCDMSQMRLKETGPISNLFILLYIKASRAISAYFSTSPMRRFLNPFFRLTLFEWFYISVISLSPALRTPGMLQDTPRAMKIG